MKTKFVDLRELQAECKNAGKAKTYKRVIKGLMAKVSGQWKDLRNAERTRKNLVECIQSQDNMYFREYDELEAQLVAEKEKEKRLRATIAARLIAARLIGFLDSRRVRDDIQVMWNRMKEENAELKRELTLKKIPYRCFTCQEVEILKEEIKRLKASMKQTALPKECQS